MNQVENSFEVELKIGKEKFEVLVDFDKLEEFKKDPSNIDIYDVLSDYKIYKDIKKGEIASIKTLKENFNIENQDEILKKILLEGKPQIPTSYYNKQREEIKEKIINYIVENSINPTTNSRYTKNNIIYEFDKLKYNIEIKKDFKNQAEQVLDKMKNSIPIKLELITFILEVPCQFIGKVVGNIRKYGKIKKEFYDNYGNLHLHLEMMLGQKESFINFYKNATNSQGAYSINNN